MCGTCRKAVNVLTPTVVNVARSPDVVVVGAGVVGASCAYHLAAAGVRVQLLRPLVRRVGQLGRVRGQRARVGQGARARAAARAALGRAVGRRWPQRLPDDFEYDRKGSIVVAETEAELAPRPSARGVLAGLGVHGEVLDADALRREEPYAAHDLPGGVLYPGDAQLEPRLATAALVRAAVARAARRCRIDTLDRPAGARRATGA